MPHPDDDERWREIEAYWGPYLAAFDEYLLARTEERRRRARARMRAEFELRMSIDQPGWKP